MTLELAGDLTLFADGFDSVNGLNVKSTNGKVHTVTIVVPGSPLCTAPNSVKLSAGTTSTEFGKINVKVAGQLTLNGTSNISGNVSAGCFTAKWHSTRESIMNIIGQETPHPKSAEERMRLLHLLWAIPTAFILSVPIWGLAQWGLCYLPWGSCSYDSGISDVVTGLGSLGILLVACGVWFGVLRFAPWTANKRLRRWVALGAACSPILAIPAIDLYRAFL